jgi:tetratricopeptide (TPR) repeat protein
VSAVGGAQRVDGLEAPLTGRDAELRTIKDLFHAAAERRMPRLILVSGPAGVGKSRLGWEFEKYADGLAAEVWWHRGRCLSYGEGVAFWALAEIVRQRLGIAEEDPAAIAAAKLTAGLDELVPDPGERAYIGARLGRLLGVAFDGENAAALGREELFAGWRLFFERLAAVRPVVLLIEDAQYADSALLDFLDHLTDWVRDLPVYVLVFARPELSQARSGFGSGRNRSMLTLDPLDPASMDKLVDALVPGMPPAARRAITSRAQGVPLFAVETVRSLIDRDIVQPVEGVYRLVGAIGELAVPGSLHALLAARLDALEPGMRRLTADAAVLGGTFPAEALVAVSGQDEPAVRAALTELLRREVLTVSADPLSPERGSYQFVQEILRQVAYDTLSRRDRKSRHLTVAAHLRAVFPSDGEEVADVIARHYLDALTAVPDDPDTTQIRGQAVTALIRAAERAERTGAPARAATSYATAAELNEPGLPGEQAGALWERAANAALASANHAMAIEQADRARDYHGQRGQERAAARATAIAGRALRQLGRHSEARQRLSAAVAVLRPDPDPDTVVALNELALVEVFAFGTDASRLTTEVLALGQDLDVDAGQLSSLFLTRGIHLCLIGHLPEGAAYLRESARLATQIGDYVTLGRALLNLAETLAVTDPAAAEEAARTATEHLRRVGHRAFLGGTADCLVGALLLLGDWDAAEAELTRTIDTDGLSDLYVFCKRGLLSALRGDVGTAESTLAELRDARASEDPQDQAMLSMLAAFTAAARREPESVLRLARDTVAYASALGMTHEYVRWAWPLAARTAYELRNAVTIGELLALADSCPAGRLAPMIRAERDLLHARQAGRDGDDAARDSFAAAITGLRSRSTPYHLAHGLLDYAEYLIRVGDADSAALAVAEARGIGDRLNCPPLGERADAIERTRPPVRT